VRLGDGEDVRFAGDSWIMDVAKVRSDAHSGTRSAETAGNEFTGDVSCNDDGVTFSQRSSLLRVVIIAGRRTFV
jgi:hypothetical protein